MFLILLVVTAVILISGIRIAQECQRAQAADQMAGNPAALELRRFQMISEVGAENNSTTVLMIPSDFATLSKSLSQYLQDRTGKPNTPG